MYRSNLKFRIWDTEEKKWFEPIYRANEGALLDLSIGLSGDVIRRTLQYSSEHESMFENKYIVCRFSGLKDPYGTEIYEGDHFGQPQMMVTFSDGCFMLGGMPLIGYLNGKNTEQVGRVRGNIYEHD